MGGIEWNTPEDFPEELSKSKDNFSIDVLIYSKEIEEHTIGWFDFRTMTWQFLCRQAYKRFKWRYFSKEIDTYK